MRIATIVLLAFNLLLATNLFADTTLEFGVYNSSEKRIRVDAVKIRAGVVRLPEVQGNYMLFRENGLELVQVSPGEKSYTSIKPGSMDEVKKQTREVLEKVQETLAQMPAEQRAQIQQALDKLDSNLLKAAVPVPRIKVVQTGRTQRFNGKSCTVTQTFIDETKRFEICFTQASDLGVNVADATAYSNYMKYMVNFSGAISSSTSDGAGLMSNRGIPLSTTQFLQDGSVARTLLENVSTQALDPELFVIPKGFKNRAAKP